jgi:hypothetical protein
MDEETGWEVADNFLPRKGKILMRGWRIKFIFLLIVYFSGFATAIYCLAPAPENQSNRADQESFFNSALKSDDFAQSLNSGMRRCIDFGKDAGLRVSKFLKQKLEDKQFLTDG